MRGSLYPVAGLPTLMQTRAQEAQWGDEWLPRLSQGSPLRRKSAELPCEVWWTGSVRAGQPEGECGSSESHLRGLRI